MNTIAKTPPVGLIWLCAALLTWWAYQPGLSGSFMFDDFHAIVLNDKISAVKGGQIGLELTDAAVSSTSGILRRPVSMVSFAINHATSGMDPHSFKLTNLVLHLVSGLIAFLLCRGITRSLSTASDTARADFSAAFAAALWLLHPLNLSTVLYIVQRMTVLASLFTLIGLLCYVEGRRQMISQGRGLFRALGGLTVFGLLATLSKENGALIIVYALVIEAICFRFASQKPHDRKLLGSFFVLTLLMPAVAAVAWTIFEPSLLQRMYQHRDFSLTERLLTQSRIIWHYVSWIAAPLPSSLALYHDDIAVSRSLISPGTTVVALLAVLIVVTNAVCMYRRWPLYALAVLWFTGGHLMESTAIPLEMVFEHRNYLPMLGPLLATTMVVARIDSSPGNCRALILLAVAAALLAALTHARARDWSSSLSFAQAEAAHHPASARANYEAGRETQIVAERDGTLIRSAPTARSYFARAMDANPAYAHAAAGQILTYMDEGNVPQKLIVELAHRMRITPDPKAAVVLGVLRAYENGRIKLNPEQVLLITEALLENPRATIRQRAITLNELGRLHLLLFGDAQKAVNYTLAAIEQEPNNPLFRLNAANLALALGRPDMAKRYAEDARQLDIFGLYASELAEILRLHDESDSAP